MGLRWTLDLLRVRLEGLPTPERTIRSMREGRPSGSCSETSSPRSLLTSQTRVLVLVVVGVLVLGVEEGDSDDWWLFGRSRRLPETLIVPPPVLASVRLIL